MRWLLRFIRRWLRRPEPEFEFEGRVCRRDLFACDNVTVESDYAPGLRSTPWLAIDELWLE
jgi:hypothetical protein